MLAPTLTTLLVIWPSLSTVLNGSIDAAMISDMMNWKTSVLPISQYVERIVQSRRHSYRNAAVIGPLPGRPAGTGTRPVDRTVVGQTVVGQTARLPTARRQAAATA